MQCFVYRSLKKRGLYVYLPEKDDFSSIPDDIQKSIGDLEFALELTLEKDRKLAKENAATVMENLEKNGLHIQMPEDLEPILEAISRGKDT